METQKQQIRKKGDVKQFTGTAARFVLILFSFLQAHWLPIACAAGTVAAATMFGDKGYLTGLMKESETMLKEGKSKDAVAFMESKIAEYQTWRLEHLNDAEKTDQYLPSLYFQLARAQESAGVSAGQFVENYKKAALSNNTGGYALARLYDNLSLTEYKKLVTGYIEKTSNDDSKKFPGSNVAKQFEQSGNWPAFRDFVEIAFKETQEPVEYARIFERGLSKDGAWLKEYMAFCRQRPDLVEYVFEKDYRQAEDYKKQENFVKAAEVYESILEASGSDRDTSQLKLTLCETLFNAGEYQKMISRIDALIDEYKSSNRPLVKDALLMKGRAYIQLGEVGKATDEFFSLMIEYPETKQAPEANFFIGYCYMLQGKFDQAKEAMDLVTKDYPESSYSSKARLCLTRIEGMTEK